MCLTHKRLVLVGSGTLVLMGSLLAWSMPEPSHTPDFRVETDIFLDDAQEPTGQTLTIFADGVIYDFLLSGDEEITVFDQKNGRIVLLDSKRKAKTTLSTESILSFTRQMEGRLNDAQRAYLLPSQMETNYDEATGWLTMSGERVIYRAQGVQPKFAEAAAAYQQFADWYARLNSMRLGNLPPFARIQLNAALAERRLIPQQIERTLVVKSGLNESRQVVRSQHLVNWRLSNMDRKWIDKADTSLAEFAPMTFTDYLQLPDLAVKE